MVLTLNNEPLKFVDHEYPRRYKRTFLCGRDQYRFKGGPEPKNIEDMRLCIVNMSVKYLSKLCFGTIKIQPELKYLKTILEDFTS